MWPLNHFSSISVKLLILTEVLLSPPLFAIHIIESTWNIRQRTLHVTLRFSYLSKVCLQYYTMYEIWDFVWVINYHKKTPRSVLIFCEEKFILWMTNKYSEMWCSIPYVSLNSHLTNDTTSYPFHLNFSQLLPHSLDIYQIVPMRDTFFMLRWCPGWIKERNYVWSHFKYFILKLSCTGRRICKDYLLFFCRCITYLRLLEDLLLGWCRGDELLKHNALTAASCGLMISTTWMNTTWCVCGSHYVYLITSLIYTILGITYGLKDSTMWFEQQPYNDNTNKQGHYLEKLVEFIQSDLQGDKTTVFVNTVDDAEDVTGSFRWVSTHWYLNAQYIMLYTRYGFHF